MRDFTLVLTKWLESIIINSISIFVSSTTCVSHASKRAGFQTFEKEQTNIKRKRNEHKSYIGDISVTFWQLEVTKLGTHMIVDKKIFKEVKLVFENLIFPQRAFVCWWNLHLNISYCLNAFVPSGSKRSYILKQTCSF